MIICVWMVGIGIVLWIIGAMGQLAVKEAKGKAKGCDLLIARKCFGIIDIETKEQQKTITDAFNELLRMVDILVEGIIGFEKKWGSGAYWFFKRNYEWEEDYENDWVSNLYEVAKKMKNPMIIKVKGKHYGLVIRKYNDIEIEALKELRNIIHNFDDHKIGKLTIKELIKNYKIAKMLCIMKDIKYNPSNECKDHGIEHDMIIENILEYKTIPDMGDNDVDWTDESLDDPTTLKDYSTMRKDLKDKYGITKNVNDVMEGKMSDYFKEYKMICTANSTGSNKNINDFVKQFRPEVIIAN